MKSLKSKFKKTENHDWTKYDEKLLQAVEYNDPARVASLLRRKNLVPTKLDFEGKAALHLAAMRGNVECLEVMIVNGADVMAKDSAGHTALHLAARYGHPQCVTRLLQEPCPVDVADSNGRTALHHAVSGCMSCTDTLCEFKAPLNAKDREGSTALILAAQMSHSELCQYLLHRGAGVNARDLQGRTALMLACENDSVETVEVLVHGGARVSIVDGLGHDAVHYSMATGNSLIQHFLQEAAQRRSWASDPAEEEAHETANQLPTPSPPAALPQEKSAIPKKRRAPPPPSTPSQNTPKTPPQIVAPTPTPAPVPDKSSSKPSKRSGGSKSKSSKEDKEVYEEIACLRQEKVLLLQKIRSQEQLLEKQKQERHNLEKSEEQIRDFQQQLMEKDLEKDQLAKQMEALHGRLATLENEKKKPGNGGDALQDEEAELLDFPDADMLLSKRTLAGSSEELLVVLQGQVESLTAENKDLQEKIQILESYEKDDTDMETSADFIPIILYDSLKTEFERLKEQYAEAQAAAKALENDTDGESACKLVPAEAFEQLKAEYEEQIRALREGLTQGEAEHVEDAVKSVTGTSKEKADTTAGKEEELTQKYADALAEVGRLQEQIQLGILSVEEKEGLATHHAEAERLRSELQKVKGDWKKAVEDLKQKEDRIKELESRSTSGDGQTGGPLSLEEQEKLRLSLSRSLEEVSKEKASLLEKYKKAKDELKNLQKTVKENITECSEIPSEVHMGNEQYQELQAQLTDLRAQHENVTEQHQQLQTDYDKTQLELIELKEELKSTSTSREDYQATVEKLRRSQDEANKKLQDLEEMHSRAQEEVNNLQSALETYKQEAILLSEKAKLKESLETALQETRAQVKDVEKRLACREQDMLQMQKELESRSRKTATEEDHEQIRCTLEAEVNTLNLKLNDLMVKHEKTCTEVFQVQREALFMKSERQAAEGQLATVQKQMETLKSESQRVQELHGHIEASANVVKEKDKKITELSKEVFKLKEALNSLSQLSSQGGVLPKPGQYQQQGQNLRELETLQSKLKATQQQLADTERQHRSRIALYRTHLLSAIQGHMDEEVQNVLLQILKMRRLQDNRR